MAAEWHEKELEQLKQHSLVFTTSQARHMRCWFRTAGKFWWALADDFRTLPASDLRTRTQIPESLVLD